MAENSNILQSIMSGLSSLLGGEDTNFVQKIVRGVQMYQTAKSPFTHVDEGSSSLGSKLSLASVLVGGSFDLAATGYAGENLHKIYEKVQKHEIGGGEAAREGLGEAARAGTAMWAFKAMGGANKDAGMGKKLMATIGAVIAGAAADFVAEKVVLKIIPLDKIFGGAPSNAISGGQTVDGVQAPITGGAKMAQAGQQVSGA